MNSKFMRRRGLFGRKRVVWGRPLIHKQVGRGNKFARLFIVLAGWCFVISFIAVVVPGVIVKKFSNRSYQADPIARLDVQPNQSLSDQARDLQETADHAVIVPVFLSEQNKIVHIPLEQYVAGVIAAEMPIEFELEALKAQAIVSRTYLIKRYIDMKSSNIGNLGAESDGWITNTVSHQAFLTDQQMKKNWGEKQYLINMEKINRAVSETEGLILTWKEQPINATFFSTSNGMTENSEEYWINEEPYLRSVPSPWDKTISPRYKETVSIAAAEVLNKLGIDLKLSSKNTFDMSIIERTPGNQIKKIKIAGQIFSGRDVREKLGLNSSLFEWKWDGRDIQFTTYGYGHGVGMSQWGAEGMAREGATARQIVQYYYTGVAISQISNILFEK